MRWRSMNFSFAMGPHRGVIDWNIRSFGNEFLFKSKLDSKEHFLTI